MIYRYAELRLPHGPIAHQKLRDRLAEKIAIHREVALLGQFAPQLGLTSDQACLLLRMTGKDTDDPLSLNAAASSSNYINLQETVRPSPEDVLMPGGIYVLRWFTIGAQNVHQFVELSRAAWVDFESKFDAKIFGLFTAERTTADIAENAARLLLVTRYRDHGMWETSRDPSTKAMSLFRKRHALTRTTRAASFLLVQPTKIELER